MVNVWVVNVLQSLKPMFKKKEGGRGDKGFLNNVQNCRIFVLGHALPGAGTCIMP